MNFTTITVQHSAKRTATFGGENGCTAVMRKIDPVADSIDPKAITEDSRIIMEVRADGSNGRFQVYSLDDIISARQPGMFAEFDVEVDVVELLCVQRSR